MDAEPAFSAAQDLSLSATRREAALFRAIAWLATASLCAVSWMPRDGPANYRFAWLFLVPLVWVVFASRRRLDLMPLHFGLFASAVLLHDLGAFGLYKRSFFGLEFDYYVHFYFGFVGGCFAARGLARGFGLRGVAHVLAVVLLITGVGGIHEIIEGFSTMVLGPTNGMLKTDGDPYDTQEDLLNNVLGSLAGCAVWALQARSRKRVSADEA